MVELHCGLQPRGGLISFVGLHWSAGQWGGKRHPKLDASPLGKNRKTRSAFAVIGWLYSGFLGYYSAILLLLWLGRILKLRFFFQ
jgi:hypothetical protein